MKIWNRKMCLVKCQNTVYILLDRSVQPSRSDSVEIFHRQSSADNWQKTQWIPFGSNANIDLPSKCTNSFNISLRIYWKNWKIVAYHKFILLFVETRETWKEIWQLRLRAANFSAVTLAPSTTTYENIEQLGGHCFCRPIERSARFLHYLSFRGNYCG